MEGTDTEISSIRSRLPDPASFDLMITTNPRVPTDNGSRSASFLSSFQIISDRCHVPQTMALAATLPMVHRPRAASDGLRAPDASVMSCGAGGSYKDARRARPRGGQAGQGARSRLRRAFRARGVVPALVIARALSPAAAAQRGGLGTSRRPMRIDPLIAPRAGGRAGGRPGEKRR